MSNPNYLSGVPSDLGTVAESLAFLYRRKGLAVVGSYARAAMYSQFNWSTEPLPVRVEPDAILRNINVTTPYPDGTLGRSFVAKPDSPEVCMDPDFFDREPGVPSVCGPDHVIYPLDKRVVRTRTRELDGMPVRTFSIGTHLAIEGVMEAAELSAEERQRLAAGREEFREFAHTMHAEHPLEFRPDVLYQPFQLAMNAFSDRAHLLRGF